VDYVLKVVEAAQYDFIVLHDLFRIILGQQALSQDTFSFSQDVSLFFILFVVLLSRVFALVLLVVGQLVGELFLHQLVSFLDLNFF